MTKKILFCLAVVLGVVLPSRARAEKPAPPRNETEAPNAAVIYWQAFASLPTLSGDEKTKFDAATSSRIAALEGDFSSILNKFATSLRELRRAANVAPCDWNLDYEAGPGLLLPHLMKARELSHAALLNARANFAAGKHDAATTELLAVYKMARDCGRSPVLISLLVSAAIQTNTTEVLAMNLGRLTPAELDSLAAQLKSLPETKSLADCVRYEKQIFGGWLERKLEAVVQQVNDPAAGNKTLRELFKQGGLDGAAPDEAAMEKLPQLSVKEVREMLRRLLADYDELIEIANQDFADRKPLWDKFDATLKAQRELKNPEDFLRMLSFLLLPALSKASERAEQMLVQRELVELAVRVRRHGPNAAKGTADYEATDDGFQLSRMLPGTSKPVTIRVVGKR